MSINYKTPGTFGYSFAYKNNGYQINKNMHMSHASMKIYINVVEEFFFFFFNNFFWALE